MSETPKPHHDHHGHDHGHSHSHAPKVDGTNRQRVAIAAIITGLFMLVEVVGGLISGSLALLADAGHMLTDFAALAMAWGAFMIARRPANSRYTFGYDRVSILVAFINGLTLFLVAAWIVWEAVHRIQSPVNILAGPMFAVAVGGLLVNLIVLWILRGADQHNLNIRGAVLHVLGDLLGSAAAILAAIIIWKTGWVMADPILSVLVALLILRSAYSLVKESAHVLLEGAPAALDRRKIEADLAAHIPDLQEITEIRTWSITPERPVVTVVAVAGARASVGAVQGAIKARLAGEFGVEDAVVEVGVE
ncbi:cation diffusion facilitator family transporter [Litorimonas sp. RW-G-Af-16]|uniref:cation diffusion facilitator family transporter n=1 Tax=Litorimonas sp. RW-G-Af-16 TaxID=3241168 RepID=UPI00390CB292